MWTGPIAVFPALTLYGRQEVIAGGGNVDAGVAPQSPLQNPSSQLPMTVGIRPYLPNASRTFPGRPCHIPYPELVNTIPLAIAGPAESSEPPFPGTPFTVW
jgi:hypothetical protein